LCCVLFCLSSSCCVSYVASFSGLFLFCLFPSFLLYIVVSNTYCVVFCFVCLCLFSCILWCLPYIVLCIVLFVFVVRHHYIQEKRRRQTKQYTTQYVLDTTIYKRKDKDKQNKTQHNMWLTPLYTREKTKTNKTKHNTIFVLLCILCCQFLWIVFVLFVSVFSLVYSDTIWDRHHYIQEKRRRQTKQNTTQYELDTTIYKRKDGNKQNKNKPEKLAT
jgi:uncharacterized membrane protein/heme exporter protein D